jgi:hypothetical protein
MKNELNGLDYFATFAQLTAWAAKQSSIPTGFRVLLAGFGQLMYDGAKWVPAVQTKLSVVTGANAATNITLAGAVKDRDVIISAVNLTDLSDINVAAAKAVSAADTGKYDGVLEAKTAGAAGNGISVQLIADSGTGVGVVIGVVNNVVQIHYEPDVSTVTLVNTAIAALGGAEDIIDVKTAGTGATTLTAAMAWETPRFLTGGYDAYVEVPTITSDGNIQFARAATGSKKLLIHWAKLG